MTHFRLRYIQHGNHVHVRVFVAKHANLTHAKAGDLAFNPDEWEAFLRCFQDRGTDTITVIPENGIE